jgi:hypothetical protein
MGACVHSPEGSHFFGAGVSMHIGLDGGQNMHGAHMGIPTQGAGQATVSAAVH